MRKSLILVYLTGLIVGISYGLHNPILPIFAKNIIGASYSELGLIGMSSFLPYVFIPILVGILLDRFNNGYILIFGSALNACSVYLLSIAQSVPEIMTFRIISGITHAFFWPPCMTLVSNYSNEKNRVRNISTFTMFFVAGFMLGPMFGSILIESDITYRIIFQITAFVLASTIILALLVSRNNVRKYRERFNIKSFFEMKKFPHVIIIVLFFASSFGIILSIYPAFLDDHDMSDTSILLLYFIFGISRLVSLAFVGRLAKKLNTVLILAILALSVGLLLSVFSYSILLFAVALTLMGFGFSMLFPLTLEIILRNTKKTDTGKAIGSYETIFGIGMVVGPMIGGPITHSLGMYVPYLIFGIIGIGITILVISRKRLYLSSKL